MGMSGTCGQSVQHALMACLPATFGFRPDVQFQCVWSFHSTHLPVWHLATWADFASAMHSCIFATSRLVWSVLASSSQTPTYLECLGGCVLTCFVFVSLMGYIAMLLQCTKRSPEMSFSFRYKQTPEWTWWNLLTFREYATMRLLQPVDVRRTIDARTIAQNSLINACGFRCQACCAVLMSRAEWIGAGKKVLADRYIVFYAHTTIRRRSCLVCIPYSSRKRGVRMLLCAECGSKVGECTEVLGTEDPSAVIRYKPGADQLILLDAIAVGCDPDFSP